MRLVPLVLALLPALAAARPPPVVREQRRVMVDGREERWRLEWQAPPAPFCDDPERAMTAPCERFSYGEEGKLDLVRSAGGRDVDRLALTPLFAADSAGGRTGPARARLRRWPVLDDDEERFEDASPAQVRKAVRKRPEIQLLELEDLDGDGRALEWVVTVDAYDSSSFPAIAVALDLKTNRLGAVTRAEKPGVPLVLPRAELWRTLKAGGAVTFECGDHGGEMRETLKLSRDAAGWHAARLLEACDKAGKSKTEPR